MPWKLRRFVAIGLAASAVIGGCVASDSGSDTATFVLTKRAEREPVVAAPASTAAPAAAAPAQRQVAAGAPRATKRASPAAAAGSTPRSGTSWARFDGRLTGGSYVVARALGDGLHVSPSAGADRAATLSNPLPSGAPRVVVVVTDAGEWLQVLLPIRPNASVGWIRRADVELSTVHHRVEIDRATHRLRVFDATESVVADEAIAVGKSSTPTPAGQFFTVELLQPPNPSGAYGPYAFTLSAYSDVYQTFGSGDGAVGLHGTNEPSSIGTNASHGCVRLHNAAIQRLAEMLPLGTPVFIR